MPRSAAPLVRRAAGAAFGFAVACGLAAPAAAQSFDDGVDVFIGAFRDDAKPIVVFVFSDPNQSGVAQLDSTALFAKPDYQPEGAFDPIEGCLWTYDFSPADLPSDMQLKLSSDPIYGPGSDQKTIDPFSLPSYMAREAAKVLMAQKLVGSEEEVAPYFNCTGFIWSQILAQPPEFWDNLYKELIEEKKQSG